jgi:hypothetical protein
MFQDGKNCNPFDLIPARTDAKLRFWFAQEGESECSGKVRFSIDCL